MTRFRDFVRRRDITGDEIYSASSVEGWIVDLAKRNYSHGSILSHVSGLRHYCQARGIEACLDSGRIRLMLRGLKRVNRSSPTQKCLALRVSELRKMCAAGYSEGGLRFVAMITIAFYGFLRPSEYCKSPTNHDVKWLDVRAGRTGRAVRIKLRTYKHSESPAVVTISAIPEDISCPVKALAKYREGVKEPAKSIPLFDVNINDFRRDFSEWCARAGVRARLTPHSLRRGGATWAAKVGWPDARIKAHGRWKSDAYKQYVRAQ